MKRVTIKTMNRTTIFSQDDIRTIVSEALKIRASQLVFRQNDTEDFELVYHHDGHEFSAEETEIKEFIP